MLRIFKERFACYNWSVQLKCIDIASSRNEWHSRRIYHICITISTLIELSIRSSCRTSNPLEHVDITFIQHFCPIAIYPFFDTIQIVSEKICQTTLRYLFPSLDDSFNFILFYINHFTQMISFQQIMWI